MAGVFINELVVNSRAQGTPVSFKASRAASCWLRAYLFPARRQPHARAFGERPH